MPDETQRSLKRRRALTGIVDPDRKSSSSAILKDQPICVRRWRLDALKSLHNSTRCERTRNMLR
jgi:hypothetical protein